MAEDQAIELGLQYNVAEDSSPDQVIEQALEALVVPADAFPGVSTGVRGHVVLEVRGMVKPGGQETLVELLKTRAPSLGAVAVLGQRSFARVRVPLQHESSARAAIKAIAGERGQRASVKALHGTRTYESESD